MEGRMSKYVIGYTSGVYDLFHIGHLNLLKNAKGLCDKLIVGVTTDELVSYKNKRAVIPFSERIEIVRNIKYVDAAIAQEGLDKSRCGRKSILMCCLWVMTGITAQAGMKWNLSLKRWVCAWCISPIPKAQAQLYSTRHS